MAWGWAIAVIAFVAVVVLLSRLHSITIRFKDADSPLVQEVKQAPRSED